MECKEFKEISEAYLNDELLVETNLQVFKHLENCPNCRTEFAAKRALREKMREVVKNSAEFAVDPVFARRVSANLKETAVGRRNIFSMRFLAPAFASVFVLLAIAATVFFMRSSVSAADPILAAAVGDHKDCAVEKLSKWEGMAGSDFPQKAEFTEQLVKPLRAGFSADVEMLHAHECQHDGVQFMHVVLRSNGRVFSVLMRRDNEGNSDMKSSRIDGMELASFTIKNTRYFVVSDIGAERNLIAAQAIRAANIG